MLESGFISHKGQNGRPLLVSGSPKYHGAPILAGLSCLRAGADYCYLLVRGPHALTVAGSSPNFIVSDENGAWREFHYTHVLMGPGLDTTEESVKLFRDVLSTRPQQLTLDADGIRIVSTLMCTLAEKERDELVSSIRSMRVILTPNLPEFKQLYHAAFDTYPAQYEDAIATIKQHFASSVLGPSFELLRLVTQLSRHRKQSTSTHQKAGNLWTGLTAEPMQLALFFNGIIVVKGIVDVIASPADRDTHVITIRGQPKRSAGQGDVLAGAIAGLCGRLGHDNIAAACAKAAKGTRLAAQQAYEQYREGVTALDIVEFLPRSLSINKRRQVIHVSVFAAFVVSMLLAQGVSFVRGHTST